MQSQMIENASHCRFQHSTDISVYHNPYYKMTLCKNSRRDYLEMQIYGIKRQQKV